MVVTVNQGTYMGAALVNAGTTAQSANRIVEDRMMLKERIKEGMKGEDERPLKMEPVQETRVCEAKDVRALKTERETGRKILYTRLRAPLGSRLRESGS
jgi:hypothetical protein